MLGCDPIDRGHIFASMGMNLCGRSERDSTRSMTNSRDRMRSNEAKHEAKRERGDVTRDDDSSPRSIFVGAGRKDIDKNRVATRGNSNNFIIIERKHRVIYAVPFNDLRPRATFTATRLPRKISLFLSLFALENWCVQMEINLAISGENGIASSKTEITRGKLASILAKFGDE